MIRLRNWVKWQGRGIADVRRMRESRGTSPERPYAMGWICVATSFGDEFRAFASIVGARNAESFLVRTLQYAGLHSAFGGEIHVSREAFGPIVLTREGDMISGKLGAKVYDALVGSSIAEEFPTRSEHVANASETSRVATSRNPAVPCPDETRPPCRDADEGGAPPSASANNGHGELPQQERAVLEALYTAAAKRAGSAPTDPDRDRLRAARKSLLPDPTQADVPAILALIDELTPRFAKDVHQARATFVMAQKARNGS